MVQRSVQGSAMRAVGVATGVLVLALSGCTDSGSGEKTSTSVPAPETAEPKGDGTFTIGSLLPRSGDAAGGTPGQAAAVKLAVEEINAAGGVNGKPAVQVDGDTLNPNVVTDLTGKKVDVALGNVDAAQSSALAAAKIPGLLPSPLASDIKATPGYTFQFGAPPTLLAAAAGDAVAKDGKKKVGVLAPAGAELDALKASLTAAKVELATEPVGYDDKSGGVTVAVTKVKSANPDAIIVLSDDTSAAKLVNELNMQRMGPANVPSYLAGPSNATLAEMPAGALNGAKVLQSGAEVKEPLAGKLAAAAPGAPTGLAPETYDAVISAALAATAAKDDDGTVVGENVPAVTSDGTECTSYKACVDLLKKGTDIRYHGVSGPIELGAEGVRRAGSVTVYQVNGEAAVNPVGFVTAKSA